LDRLTTTHGLATPMQSGSQDITPFEVLSAPQVRLSGEHQGEGRALVCLHGLTATRRYVLQGSRMLARSGWRTFAYDARGHGASFPPPDPAAYEYDDLVADLAAVLDELGLERAVLAGSSMGAATAMAFALARPERVEALVQITPAFDGDAQMDRLEGWDARADALERGDIDGFVALTGADRLPESVREPAVIAVRQRLERHEHPAAVADALRVVPRSRAFDGLDLLDGLDVPTLVVGSRDDTDPEHPLAVAEEYARRLPRGELVVEDPGAAPLAWQGARLSRAIASFFGQS
jgi:pimeloyl-ACP methyl ester carboxylesterase